MACFVYGHRFVVWRTFDDDFGDLFVVDHNPNNHSRYLYHGWPPYEVDANKTYRNPGYTHGSFSIFRGAVDARLPYLMSVNATLPTRASEFMIDQERILIVKVSKRAAQLDESI